MTSIQTKYSIILVASLIFSMFLFSQGGIEAKSDGTVILTPSTKKYDLYSTMHILTDKEKKLTIDDVSSYPYKRKFQASDLIEQKGGFFPTSKWLRFEVENESTTDDKWLLEIAFHFIPELILYEDTTTGFKEIIHTGSNYPFQKRDINHRNFVFNLPVKAGESKTFYLLLHAGGDMHPPIHIWRSDVFLEKTQLEFILLGAFYGLTSVMILYNLFLYVSLRIKSYLFYVLVIFSTMIAYLQNDGVGFQYIWPHSPFWNSIVSPLFVSFTCIFMLLFTRRFLKTDTYFPRFKSYSYALMIASASVIILLFISKSIALNVMLACVTSTFVLVFIVGIICWIRGARQARYFVLAWSIYLTGILITILTTAAMIPYYLITDHAAHISISFEAILLSFALADNFNIIRKDKELAEQKVIQSQEQMVENLTEADEVKDEFLAITSHELRTPLYGMIGIAESIRDGVTGSISTELDEQLSIIVSSGNRLTNLVNDMLDFSKLKHNALKVQLQATHLFEVVEVVLLTCRPLIKNKPIQLVNFISPSLPLIMADQNRLQQIFYNIIGNAIKYSKQGTIGVYAEQGKHRITISITDQGKGIPTDQLKTIFDSFQQGDVAISREFGGTGIGLSITKKLVELHDGNLEVTSTIGEGTTFSFSLSVHNQIKVKKAKEEVAIAIEPSFTNQIEPSIPTILMEEEIKAKIIVVDDEPVNLQVLMNQLSLEGYDVITAANGNEVLSLIETNHIDLLILDIMMPEISGYEVCQQLREQYSLMELPILMLTAKNQIRDKLLAFEVGANDYLTKPCDKQELLSRVRTLVHMKHLNQKLIDLNVNLEQKVQDRTHALEKANTELTKMNDDLTSMTKSRRQLLENISHELGTPVTMIHSYLQALKNNLVRGDDSYFQDLVNDKIKLLDRLINDLSDLSTLESGETNIVRTKTILDVWFESIHLQQEFDVFRYKRNFTKQFDRKEMYGYYCFIDEARMNQVFSNIIRNAVKNTVEHTGKITLVAQINHLNKQLHVQITDNGSGISKDDLPYIFERFYKGTHPTVDNAQRRTGLGLAIVKEIIHAHDGEIYVESTLDKGTTFFITLPIFNVHT